jgi:uncharacterized protein (TIGR00369 family)
VIEAPRTRSVTWEDPTLSVEAARGKSGLEALLAIVSGDVPPPPIAVLLGFRIADAGEGFAVFEGTPAEYHYNPMGVVHGGFALTLLDSALGCAVLSTLPAGAGYTTTDTQVRLIRAMTKDTGPVRCEARVVHVGRTTGIAQGRLTDASGKLLAFGTSACAIFR